ncbi:hypothetical protein, partial [Prevotella sp. HMSC073D09]|uniref:hypothetical protein n=1 Tax=Prevotella sp. HMSC073D09 TaxID=1739459 RepID=UPI001AEFDE00
MYQKGNLWRVYRQYIFTSYRETELHLENCCLQRARRALQGMNNPLRGRKGVLLFADDAAVAFQIPFCLTIKASLQWHIMRKRQRGVLLCSLCSYV